MIANVSGSEGCRANPVAIDINAALHYGIHHRVSTNIMVCDRDTASFPGVDHFVLAEPLSCKHDTVMGSRVEIQNVVKTELNVLMSPAQSRVTVVVSRGEVSNELMAVIHVNSLSVEESMHVTITDIVVSNIEAHFFLNVVHVFLADKSMIHFEAASVLKSPM